MTESMSAITGGTIASEYGTFRADIVIRDGRIAGLLDDASDIPGERIDATGLVIFPGGIDMHVHMREPSRLEREGFAFGTASAAAGGITTVVEMPQADPLVTDVETFRHKRDLASASSLCDFGLYAAAVGQGKGELAALLAEGALAFKAFLCQSSPGYPRLDDAMLLTCLQHLHDLDALLIVHAENDDLLQAGLARMAETGRTDPLAHAESRPPIVETEAINRAIHLAAYAHARLHVAHVSTAGGVRAVLRARHENVRVTCETCPQYLLMDLDDLVRLGPLARCAPAIRAREEVEALWPLVVDGSVDALASDHSPYMLSEKEAGLEDIFRATLGLNIIQTMLPAVADEGFNQRSLTFTRFANLTAAQPARILGLYPRKGSIQVGTDADLALWDLNQEWEVRRDDLFSRHPWTPLEGRRLQGRPVMTVRRGQIIYRDGAVVAEPGTGRFLAGSHAAASMTGTATVAHI
jgi:allantoinase